MRWNTNATRWIARSSLADTRSGTTARGVTNRLADGSENFAVRLDGNNVDPQQEMARMAENQLMHELTMRLVKGKINSLANAIKEGGR